MLNTCSLRIWSGVGGKTSLPRGFVDDVMPTGWLRRLRTEWHSKFRARTKQTRSGFDQEVLGLTVLAVNLRLANSLVRNNILSPYLVSCRQTRNAEWLERSLPASWFDFHSF